MPKIKHYEYWTRNGKVFGKWFVWNGMIEEKWQFKNRLKNEYKEVSDEEWKKIQEKQ